MAVSNAFFDMQLYRSDCAACPYLPDRVEQQIYAVLEQNELDQWADRLNRIGFRRSMHSVYMPLCPGCQACESVRVLVQEFAPSHSMRRVRRRNADLEFHIEPPSVNEGLYDLFKRYLSTRHTASDMNDVSERQFRKLIEVVPAGSFQLGAYLEGKVIGMMMVDLFADGTSAVYSFYDPDHYQRSLGVMLILELIRYSRSQGLRHAYLGYYIAEAKNMAYKARFQPLEVFDWEAMSWRPFAR